MAGKILESDGFLFGYGLFETMQSYRGKIFSVGEHLDRLYSSARKIDLKITQPRSSLNAAIHRALRDKGLQKPSRAYIRLNVWKENKKSNFSVIVRKYSPPSKKQYQRGFKAVVSSFRVDERSPLASVKSLNYLQNILARNEAQKKGFDEAVLLNSKGRVAEGSRSNIFIVKRNQLLTPSLDCGILPGITRKIVIRLAKKNKIKVRETELTLKNLESADEAFLTNSLLQIMPLTQINKIRVGNAKTFSVTRKLMDLYERLDR